METIESIIRQHIFFRDLKEEYLSLIIGCAKTVVFKPGEIILEEGKLSEYFYLIRGGVVAVEIAVDERKPIVVQTICGGDILGWSWLIPPYQSRFNCRAVDLTRTIAFDGKCLRNKCEENHDLGYDLLKRLAGVLAQRLEAARFQLINLYETK
ncbi:MAG: cyclic nucleotide-binding domain-containing protein [Candidatus Omnitrophota bacterium]